MPGHLDAVAVARWSSGHGVPPEVSGCSLMCWNIPFVSRGFYVLRCDAALVV